jgi:hypothetical protein
VLDDGREAWDELASGCGELDDDGPAVVRMRIAFEVPLLLEAVQEPRHAGGVGAEDRRQPVWARFVESQPEQDRLLGRKRERGELSVE